LQSNISNSSRDRSACCGIMNLKVIGNLLHC
jgi:hypothetical protein